MSVFRSRFFWKIYSAFSLLFLVTTLLTSWVVFYRVQQTMKRSALENLRDKIAFVMPHASHALQTKDPETLALLKELGESTGSRITLVDDDGDVLIDSEADPRRMDNHFQRPEIQAAILNEFGTSERFSSSVQESMAYMARALRDGPNLLGVVRVSLPLDRINRDLASLQFTIGVVAICGVFLALAIGWTLAKRVTVPIREMMLVAEALRAGRYEKKVRTLTDDELGRLGDTLNRLGSELTNKITELHRLENVRRDFVANVSHEIKTPLTSIKGYVETLLAGAINEPGHNVRFLEKIQRNCTRLADLVQDILSLAKIESGHDLYKPTPIAWEPIVSSVLARHEDDVHQKHLKIKVQAEHPVHVMGDKEAMTQVLDNLISNAVKYTPEGGRITVTLATKGEWGKLVVEDTGIGIPAEHLDRIFERFYRVDKARSREMGGTGLGLSIVKHLVSGMNGEIGVESNVGVGSRFIVRLKMAS